MKKVIFEYFVIIFSIVGSLASIIGLGVYFIPYLDKQGWVGVLFLGILGLAFFVQNFYLTLKYGRKSKYAEIFEDLNLGFSELNKLERNQTVDETEIIGALASMCDSVSGVFSRLYGHHISVCVKFLTKSNEQPFVLTLARDKKSLAQGRTTGHKDTTIHYLYKNTDFNFIFSHFENDNIDTSHFYLTKLPQRRDYTNTRLKNWPPADNGFSLLNSIVRRNQWPLKYRCTLVVPIVPLFADEQDKNTIRGFLCLDSPKNVTFNKGVDVEILKGIADLLHFKMAPFSPLENNLK